MPIIGAKGAMSSQGFGEFAQSGTVTYIEDVFSTYLFSATNAYVDINNGIDLLGKGGLVWEKLRNGANDHRLTDTARGAGYIIKSNTTAAQVYESAVSASAFYNNGFRGYGSTGEIWASWTFRKQPKFFDVVTWTGNSVSGRVISHNLGATPGFLIVKRTDTAGYDWICWHNSFAATDWIALNTTNQKFSNNLYWNNTLPTSSGFTVSADGHVNQTGGTYVAYLFASNAGGFGLTGTDNVISCGSYTGGGASAVSVNLGYEVQWLLVRDTAGGNWYMFDNMRGAPNPSSTNTATLKAESTAAEVQESAGIFTATGFSATSSTTINSNGSTYIYIAIRRGPMKVPTSGTEVFCPKTYTVGTSDLQYSGVPVIDMAWWKATGTTSNWAQATRLQGSVYLSSNDTTAETSNANIKFDGKMSATTSQGQTFYFGSLTGGSAATGLLSFRRAPSFFDVVCYTGTGANTTQAHNLGVVPELIIVKVRTGSMNWPVYSAAVGNTKAMPINNTGAPSTSATFWNSTTPTASVFSLGTFSGVNTSGIPYVAYLFASCPGVSKIGSYTGTGATQTISCGFTGGARFVLIKRTGSTGDWYVWDTARGMVSGTDPSLLLNTTAAEVNANSVYTTTGGFQIVSTAAGINASGGTYIYLAIA